MNKLTKIIIASLVVMVALAGIVFVLTRRTGTLQLSKTPSDAAVTVDGKQQAGNNLKLNPGTHSVVITKTGYITQSQTVSMETGKTVSLAISLVQKSTENVVNQTITSTVYKKYPNYNLQVMSAKVLDGGTWIVARVQGNSDPGIVVLKQDSSSLGYSVFLGPGTSFDPSFVQTLPADVQAAMKASE